MIHKAWSRIEKLLYYFQGHVPNLRSHMTKQLMIFTQIEHFQTITPIWITRPIAAIKSLRFVLFSIHSSDSLILLTEIAC